MTRATLLLLLAILPAGQVGAAELLYGNTNGGGGFSESELYQVEFSGGETMFGTVEAAGGGASLLFGLPAQTYTAISLSVGGAPAQAGEGDAVPLTFTAGLDDGTALQLPGDAAGWFATPNLTALLPDGTALLGHVYADTSTSIEFRYLGATAPWFFDLDNTGDDDFGLYAHDGVHDLYQVLRFGENDPLGNGFIDRDGDGASTLEEYALGDDPELVESGKAAPFSVDEDHPESPNQNVIRFRRRDDGDGALPLLYELWASADLLTWEHLSDQISQGDPDAGGFVEVEFQDPEHRTDHLRRFYKIEFVPKDQG